MFEAHRLAKKEVINQIRCKGERTTDYTHKEIVLRAEAWLQANPQLIEQARANVQMVTASEFIRG
jgi:hypothetical protein